MQKKDNIGIYSKKFLLMTQKLGYLWKKIE